MRTDKSVLHDSLSIFCEAFQITRGVMSQWDLLLCSLMCVWRTKENPIIWIWSFTTVNLHPCNQLPFADLLEKINQTLQAADTFKLDADSESFDPYVLLPAFWHRMTPKENRLAIKIVDNSPQPWGHLCLMCLRDEYKIVLADMTAL